MHLTDLASLTVWSQEGRDLAGGCEDRGFERGEAKRLRSVI